MREVLGLEVADDRYYLFIAGEYTLVGGVPIEIEGFEDLDLFIAMIGTRYIVGEGITGAPLTMGASPEEAVERAKVFLYNLGRLYTERRVAEKIFEEGRLSPRYRLFLSRNLCKKCKSFRSLHGKDVCYRCYFVEPSEELEVLLKGGSHDD